MSEELSTIEAMCNADFQNKVFKEHLLKDRLNYLTIEWAQQAYDRSRYIVGIDLAKGTDFTVVNGELIQND